MNKAIIFMGMGFEMVGIVLGGYFVGSIIDAKMNWPGYGVAFIMVAGLISWILHLFILLKRFMNEPDDNTPNSSN